MKLHTPSLIVGGVDVLLHLRELLSFLLVVLFHPGLDLTKYNRVRLVREAS